MATVMSFRDAWESVPADLWEKAREELLVLSHHLYAVDEKWSQLGPEARMIWLDAQPGMGAAFGNVEAFRRLLAKVSSVVGFLDNWQQMVGGDLKDDDYDYIVKVSEMGESALRALFAIVDYARSRTAGWAALPDVFDPNTGKFKPVRTAT